MKRLVRFGTRRRSLYQFDSWTNGASLSPDSATIILKSGQCSLDAAQRNPGIGVMV